MTEQQWQASTSPGEMLAWLTTRQTASNYRSYPDGWVKAWQKQRTP